MRIVALSAPDEGSPPLFRTQIPKHGICGVVLGYNGSRGRLNRLRDTEVFNSGQVHQRHNVTERYASFESTDLSGLDNI